MKNISGPWSYFTFLDVYDAGANNSKEFSDGMQNKKDDSLQDFLSKLKCSSIQSIDLTAIPKQHYLKLKKIITFKKKKRKYLKTN